MSTYQYENSDPERFQLFCQSLLVSEYQGLQCFPVGQPDGGRDAAANREVSGRPILQVKFKRAKDQLDDPADWIIKTLEAELPKVQLLKQRGATEYIVASNARGTGHLDGGSIDRVNDWMSRNVPLPSTCMWRNDLDRRLDGNFNLKWRFPELLNGTDGVRLALESTMARDASRRSLALNGFLRKQLNRDSEVKFKQVDLENDLLSLFVDVPATVTRRAKGKVAERESELFTELLRLSDREEGESDDPRPDSDDDVEVQYIFHERFGYVSVSGSRMHGDFDEVGMATLLLSEHCQRYFPMVVLEGAPGQGKSTLAQYVCQVHRARYLNVPSVIERLPAKHKRTPLKLPLKVDLRDLAVWLTGRDPFIRSTSQQPQLNSSLEAFLARLIEFESGGIEFTALDLHETVSDTPTLLFLDGLDEVADKDLRQRIVDEVIDGLDRLGDNKNIQAIVTSRPAAFANSAGFPTGRFTYFELGNVSRRLALEYGEKWIEARGLNEVDAVEVRSILTDRLSLPHIQDLARNPMQLAILLTLIHTVGQSLPDERTELYRSYMDKFLTREADKTPAVRTHRALLVTLHQYIAWVLQNQAEKSEGTAGSVSPDELRELIHSYLTEHDHPLDILDDLFNGVLERIYVLVQRVDGLYEFEVQPLREYFCASHLYETAPSPMRGEDVHGTRDDRFHALIRNPYWTNVTRFYAGNYTSGELGNLVLLLEDFIEDRTYRYSSRPRQLPYMLLSDWVFKASPRATKTTALMFLDELGLKLCTGGFAANRRATPIALPADCGRSQLQARVIQALDEAPESASAPDLSQLLLRNGGGLLTETFVERALTTQNVTRTTWLRLGLLSGSLRKLSPEMIESLLCSDGADADTIAFRASMFTRYAPIASSQSDVVIESFLRGCLTGADLEPDSGPSSWFSGLRTLLVPSFSPTHGWLGHGFAVDLRRGKTRELSSRARISAPLSTFLSETTQLASRVAEDEVTVFQYWREVLEASRRSFGESWSSWAAAAQLSGLVDKNERGTGADALFDESSAVLDRARHARLKRDSETWWQDQLAAARDDTQRWAWALLVLLWGKPRPLYSALAEIDEMVQRMSREDFKRFFGSLEGASPWSRSRTSRTLDPSGVHASSARLRVCLSRLGLLDSSKPDRMAVELEKSDPLIARIENARHLERVIMNEKSSMKRYLQGVSALYALDGPDIPWIYLSSRRRRRLDRTAAKSILAAPSEYPYEFVVQALRSLQDEPVVPLADIAAEEAWTFE